MERVCRSHKRFVEEQGERRVAAIFMADDVVVVLPPPLYEYQRCKVLVC